MLKISKTEISNQTILTGICSLVLSDTHICNDLKTLTLSKMFIAQFYLHFWKKSREMGRRDNFLLHTSYEWYFQYLKCSALIPFLRVLRFSLKT